MPLWLVQLLAALPQIVAELPALYNTVVQFVDMIIAIFNQPTPPASMMGAASQSEMVNHLKTLRAAVVAAKP